MNIPLHAGLIPERADTPPPPTSAASMPTEAETAPRIDLHGLRALLQRNLLVILVAIGTALALGLLVTALTTPKYVAQSRIQIEQQTERVLSTEDQAPNAAQDAERFLQTQTDVLRSRSIAIAVAQSLKLFGSPAFHTAMGVAPRAAASVAGERERTISLLRGNLAIDLPRNSRILTLAFEARSPQVAADIANAFARSFISSNLERKFSSSAYARDFLSGQLVEAKARLERSERDLNAYARATGLIAARPALGSAGKEATTSPQSMTTASLQQLNDAYNTARAARIEAEQRWRSAAAIPVMSIPDVLGSQAIQTLLGQRATMSADLRETRQRYRSEYPELQEKVGQLDEVNAQIASLANNIRQSIHARYDIAASQERQLAATVGGLKSDTLSEQDRSVRFTVLSREVDTNRTLYDGLLQRFKELSAAAGIASNNISIVDVAEPPLRPASPQPLLNMATALLCGIVLAGALTLLREQIDDVVRGPVDIERKLQLASLGVVPRLAAGAAPMAELSEPKSPLTESYAALRSALLYSTADGLPASILVTSAQAGEGKSTTSVAVATGFAKLGRRVVLLDADMRRPSLHKLIPGAGSRGLSDLLIGAASVAELTAAPVGDNLWLIPAGTLPPNPTDLLTGGRLPEVIRALQEQFDLLVVDGPPVLGLADAPMLGANTAATMFVVEANRGLRGRTKSAIRRLRLNHAHVLGALLTKFEARKAGVDQYYGYEYYNYSGSKGDA